MNVLFNKKPTTASVLFIITIWLFLIWMAIGFSGCKSRKVQKDYSKSFDKTEIGSVVSKMEITKDSTKSNSVKTVKTETKENDSTVTEITTETEFFKPDSLTPPNSKKYEKRQEKSNHKGVKQGLSNEDLAIQLNNGNIQEINLDSSGFANNNKKEIVKGKKIDAKMNWIQIGVGIGIAILLVFCVYIWYVRTK